MAFCGKYITATTNSTNEPASAGIGTCPTCGYENVELRRPDRPGASGLCDVCHKHDTLDAAIAELQTARSALNGKGDVESAICHVEDALDLLVEDFPFTFGLSRAHPRIQKIQRAGGPG